MLRLHSLLMSLIIRAVQFQIEIINIFSGILDTWKLDNILALDISGWCKLRYLCITTVEGFLEVLLEVEDELEVVLALSD